MGDTAQIICFNLNCQAPNPETHRFCQQCRTPLEKRYLWVVGKGVEALKPGKLIGDRFLLKQERILLDTQPGIPLPYTEDIADWILPYLRLFPYQLQVPQVYGKLPPHKKGKYTDIWLLEQSAIQVIPNQKPGKSPMLILLPELTKVWHDATPMRQLNWLWQIAHLWQPLESEGVAASLLDSQLLRVEGQVVRLLELQKSPVPEPTLRELGQFWWQLVPKAKPEIEEFLEQLCQKMIAEELESSEELIGELDQILEVVGRSQTCSYQIITLTDTGPTRQRNEDACFPPPSPQGVKRAENCHSSSPTVIVCDGIGGHEGGNVASGLAIETVQQWLDKFPQKLNSNHFDLVTELENSVCEANDRISQRNDNEGRSERQRMGTTLVMAKGYPHEVYITHVGDSRAYWITSKGCHQVTLDDDIASREVRLGYSLYRESLQQVGTGALVQALGMSSSHHLRPTVQRFIIDEDCIFLLCSDGLSDNDRVEQNWDKEILPVLEKKINLSTAAAKLIEIANIQNGHDNVTVGLVYYQVKQNSPQQTQERAIGEQGIAINSPLGRQTENNQFSKFKTRLLVTKNNSPSLFPLLAGITFLLGLSGLLAYLWVPAIGYRVDTLVSNFKQQQQPTATTTPPLNNPKPAASLSPGTLIQVKIPPSPTNQNLKTLLLRKSSQLPENQAIIGTIPDNTILEIERKDLREQERWLLVKVCSIPQQPKTNNPNQKPIQAISSTFQVIKPGQQGWIKQTEIEPYIQEYSPSESPPSGRCYSQNGNSET
ncbi:protein phosphatase 2C domain-containing protein [Phormidium sp. LEGE 05292]|uniref:protein phosphatase 2C domain-containing protein n=1 Tax=[Phormidium] sp. LEGE 05292 TaxID=767427 RepID=UPI00187F3B34|nr:protein phosphatase 2C domain-containing protein [Phormidium sp. LEGE 05292]MBE9225748.1 protein phosphatase 2C domain-containing protein [Phormidium sp. LEGE 05292]